MKTALAKDDRVARALMERVLRSGDSLAPEYPTLFHESSAGAFVTVEDGGETRAACAILPRDLVIGRARLRAGLIGSVVTDPAHQRRGHATRLLEAAETALREQGCAIAILWADERGFYARRGWREIGCERDFIVSVDAIERLPATERCRPARASDAPAIHRLYLAHERRVERTLEETRALLACPGMRVLVRDAIAPTVEPIAYACLGRGRDLAQVIHEWSGPADDVASLVRAHVEERLAAGQGGELYVMAPGPHGDLHGRLALAGVPSAVGVLGMGKLLDAKKLADLCASELEPPHGPHATGRVRAELGGEKKNLVQFTGPDPKGHAVTILADDLLDIALAAHGERGAARELASKLGVGPGGLPLVPFVWGLDSI